MKISMDKISQRHEKSLMIETLSLKIILTKTSTRKNIVSIVISSFLVINMFI